MSKLCYFNVSLIIKIFLIGVYDMIKSFKLCLILPFLLISLTYCIDSVNANVFSIPSDDYYVSNEDVTKYPYSSIVYFSKKSSNGKLSRGSGVVVGRDYVLTAGHVNNGWQFANIIPALKSDNSYPYGSFSGDRGKSMTSPNFSGGQPANDYALVKVNPRKEANGTLVHIGDVVKPLTIIGNEQNRFFFVGSSLATLGYPSFGGHNQFFAKFIVNRIRGDYRIDGSLASSGGNSGAPLLNSEAQVVGTYHGGGAVSAMNWNKINNLLSWGLSSETSRVYFTANQDEQNEKKRLINPEGNYLERQNGSFISSEDFYQAANRYQIKQGYHVASLTDGIHSFSTNEGFSMFIGGMTLYPNKFDPNRYYINYHSVSSNTSGEMKSQVMTYDNQGELNKNNFKLSGYIFKGWSTTVDGELKFSDAEIVNNLSSDDNGHIDLYAKWEKEITPAKQYEVTFNSNGGNEVKSIEMNDGGVIKKPTNPTKSGYQFNGWYRDENLTKAYDFNSPINENIDLYAKWEKQKLPNCGAKAKILENNSMGYVLISNIFLFLFIIIIVGKYHKNIVEEKI